MRKIQPCSVCGDEVEAEALRPTVPADFEYRYSSMLIWYWIPGTNDRHRCRLKPRHSTLVAEPIEEEERMEPPGEEEVQDAPPLGWVSV